MSFARFVSTPENCSALTAVRNVAECLCSSRSRRSTNPLYLHGPVGTGKTLLMNALVEEVTRRRPDLVVSTIQASELGKTGRPLQKGVKDEDDLLEAAQQCDLLIVEDLQQLGHLDGRASTARTEQVVQVFDHLRARERQLVFTANLGPAELRYLPLRLTSRLGNGLVVGLQPLQAASRLAILQDKAQRRQLAVGSDVLAWLAERLAGGGRQLEGAVVQLEGLARTERHPLDVPMVAAHFKEQVQSAQPSLERIAERVGSYYRVEPRYLKSRRRFQKVLLPRQVGMYLTRQLTELSLGEIGAYFGGRDHSTVLHACRKIEKALGEDVALSGAVKQLRADLG